MKAWRRWDKILFNSFCLWWFAGLIFMALRLDAQEVSTWEMEPWLKSFVLFCFWLGDLLLMVLAAANTYALSQRIWGKTATIRWGIWCVAVGAVIETIGTMTGYPFGEYVYTEKFGPRIFGILPVAIPLAWFSVIGLFLPLSIQLWKKLSWMGRSIAVASLTTMFDYLMEPFAIYVKSYWMWATIDIPFQNYLSWWVVTFLLVYFAAPREVPAKIPDVRPPTILGAMILLFAAGRLMCGG